MYDDKPGGSPTPCASPHWDTLAAIEPRLRDLEKDFWFTISRGFRSERWTCIDQVWHHAGFKRRFERLVGWHADNPGLRSGEAYDIAYRHLWDVMESLERSITRQVGC